MAEIKDSGFIKLFLDGRAPTLHYIKDNDTLYSLTLVDSNKVGLIRKNENANVSINNSEEIKAKITIIEDKDKVNDIFSKMLVMNFTHFKDYTDDIVILKIEL